MRVFVLGAIVALAWSPLRAQPGDSSSTAARDREPGTESRESSPGQESSTEGREAETESAAPETGDRAAEVDDEDEDVAPAIPRGRPPQEIREWFIEGELIHPRETLEAFLSGILESANWSESLAEDALAELLTSLGYHGTWRVQRMADGGVSVVITLEPITTVRYIVVDIEASAVERFREPIFADEIQRRMTLRSGSALARDLDERQTQLRAEADRLARFLRNDGFFDAEVRIDERPVDAHSARLDVTVTPGEPYTIGAIEVVGNTATNAERVREKFRHKRWCAPLLEVCIGTGRFTRSRLNRDIDRVTEMYQKLGYPGVRVTTDFHPAHSFKRDTKTVEFTVTIRERQRIDVMFEGNEKYEDEVLKEQLTLSKDGSYDQVALDSSAASIRQFYQTKGHFEASVAWERVRRGVFERVVFNIDRGPQLKVRRVGFEGNRALSSDRLRDVIRTREFRRIIIGESGGFATTQQLVQDAARIRQAYVSRGYADAEVNLRVSRSDRKDANAAVLAAAVASGKAAEGLYITFDIDEGEPLRVADIEIEHQGTLEVPVEDLLATTKLRVGEPFQTSALETDARRVQRAFLRRGYPRARIEPSWTRAGSQVTVHYKISPGRPARIGKILIRGNFKTSDWVIRDEMKLEEGQLLTLERTDRAQGNLRRSGLFSSVNIAYPEIDNPRSEVVNVLVNVEESRDIPLLLNFGGGFSTDSLFFSEAGATLPNLFGIGADAVLKGQLGQQIQSVQGTITLPRWIMRRALGTPFSWNLSGFWRNQLTERFGELESYGGSIALTKQGTSGFFDGWLMSLRYDFRQRNREEQLVRPAGRSDDIIQSPVGTTVSAFGPVLIIDRRIDRNGQRNPLAPANGYRLELRSSFAEDTLLGSNRFIKLGGSGQHLKSFGGRFRLYNAVRYDHGIPLGGDVLLPEVERFFAGGDVTVRGFEEDRLATEVIEQQVPPATGITQIRVRPAGGNIRFIYNLELEVVAYRWPSVSIASAVFFDTGLVTNSLDGFRPSDLRHSIGVALARLVTPFGSLSAEWALPLDPKPIGDNPRGRFHFNFGLLF